MRFHHLALSAVACVALNSFSGGYNGLATLAEEVNTSEESIAPETSTNGYTPPSESESFTFQSDVSRMLDIVVNSLYQKKDVFLRELISNASDALDKIRFISIENPSVLDEKEELEINIQYDQAEKSITITDSGIGMTKAELVSNLGTVARSGTTGFVKAMAEGKADVSMIGQFGVGFYSSFLVADRVRVASKSHEDGVQHVWETKNGQSDFLIYEDPRGDTLGRGTEITLFLKEDAVDYCDGDKIKELVEHYSEFIDHPIKIRFAKKVEVPVEEDADEEEEKKDEDEEDLEVKDEEDEEEEEKEQKMETITTYSVEQVNTHKPIWNRDKDVISDEEYKQFYKVISHDHEEPAKWSHFDAEGNVNFKALVYLPQSVPAEIQTSGWNIDEWKAGMKLYVKRVMISDDFELLPKYLDRFIKGVVDSEDLPLNVNREALQESKIISVIKKKLVRKVLDMISKFSKQAHDVEDKEDDEDKVDDVEKDEDEDETEKALKEHPYITWYKRFSNGLKMGVFEDDQNKQKLVKLLRFKTNKHNGEDDWVGVEDYIGRMKDWQDSIYYYAGESMDEFEGSEFLEIFQKKDIEVFYFTDTVDEYWVGSVPEYDGKKFVSITKANLKFKDEDEDVLKKREKAYSKKFKPLTKFLKDIFADKVTRVSISKRLESAPAIVSSGQYGQTANMEKLMAAQAFKHGDVGGGPRINERVLEINPRHPFLTHLLEMVSPGEGVDEDFVPNMDAENMAWILYDMATLKSGFDLVNSTNYGERMLHVLEKQLEVEGMELEDEIDPPIEEDEIEFDADDDVDSMNAADFDFSADVEDAQEE
eukprot:CAMPEP_0172493550 /NCGR_PEP_ID=MMETSP1066-20121228/24987_1 /TAXON_ID=671091 /ORGANISM="Coscinodiscus wailesii, Strain CCMP2513" /LENGTH=819 /DNA_ID=CAMNT_0013263761 /DNA_START=236 /DNA_END=2695 /DNA_ORIENTATION=-